MLDVPGLKKVFSRFQDVTPDFEIRKMTSGHINQTFRVCNAGQKFILQHINTAVFENAETVMQNIRTVSHFLEQKNYPHKILKPFLSKAGKLLADDCWRLFPYFENTKTFEKNQSVRQICEAARFLGEFYNYLEDLDPDWIQPAIPGFLNFEQRLSQFKQSLKTTAPDRRQSARQEIDYVLEHSGIIQTWQQLLSETPRRIIHADPKISNFLFKADNPAYVVALIDWDTLMPGPVLYDFGDMIRSYTNLKAEDDPTPGSYFSIEKYKALQTGFLKNMTGVLTPTEKENFGLAAQVVVYVQALRFLTDFLNGDTYYTTQRPGQNLDRTRNQLHLFQALSAYLNR